MPEPAPGPTPGPGARRTRRGPATAATVEAVHEELEALWEQAGFVPAPDRMAFTLAVVEAATNVVVHAVPQAQAPIELVVELSADPYRLVARLYEIGAAPARLELELDRPDPQQLQESGRGLALIQALLTQVVFERREDSNVWELRRDYHPDTP